MAVNQASLMKAAWAGIGLQILFSVVNAASTYFLKDNVTIEAWAQAKVAE